jgi:hypothetical protein
LQFTYFIAHGGRPVCGDVQTLLPDATRICKYVVPPGSSVLE